LSLGAVRGAVIIQGCERIVLTVACSKLVIQNSLECEINLASLTASVISGDSRSLTFGKSRVRVRGGEGSLIYKESGRLVCNKTHSIS
jgi:hypothetical protein